ncbi:MAG: hypothetical protein RR620_05735 [Clostridium sp.]
MKKYLNKSIFYHGDINLSPLFIAIAGVWCMVCNMILLDWSSHKIDILYYMENYYNALPLGMLYIMLYIILIMVTFFILTGNKRKKWRLQLADRFTRKDIRNREMILMYGLVLLFSAIFLISAIIYIIQNYVWIQYTTVFYQYVLVDLFKIIIIGFTTVSGLFLIDSLVINNISCFGLLGFSIVYITSMTFYIGSVVVYSVFDKGLNINLYSHNLSNRLSIWFRVIFDGFLYSDIVKDLVIPLAIILILGIICLAASRFLISKIKVENMNGFFVVNFDRRIVLVILSTFISFIITMFVTIFIEVTFFIVVNGLINISIFTIISVMIYIILKKRNGIIISLIKN